MKQYFITPAFFVIVAFLFSCTQPPKQSIEINTTIKDAEKSIQIKLLGTVRFRDLQQEITFNDEKKEIGSYETKRRNGKPELYDIMSKEDSILIHHFKRLGLTNGFELFVSAFKKETKQVTSFTDVSKKKVTITFFYDDSSRTHFKLYCNNDSAEVNTYTFSTQNLDYAFLDVIPGGNKELVFLDDYYIANGDNFDFQVYEIKIR